METDGRPLTTRVLLVEDHGGFRQYVRSALEARPELQLVAEAVDGLEAVEKCVQLQPDVVLMDIGLPRLNGIDAARRIRVVVPSCKIIFLTQERAPEIMQEAFKLGATAYVVKTRAAKDLFPALLAARDGRQFSSSAAATPQPLTRPRLESQVSGPGPRTLPGSRSHEAHIYPDDESFVAGLAAFIARSLKSQKAVLALLGPHRDPVLSAVQASGIDLNAAIAAGRFATVDDFELVTELLAEGRANRAGFLTASIEMLEKLMKSNPGREVSVCGECGTHLFAQGRGEIALQVEHVWDEIAGQYGIQAFCAYLLSDIPRESPAYEQIRFAHSLLAPH